MAKRPIVKTNFWTRLRRGPWPESTLARLEGALDAISGGLRAESEVLGLLVFGSYARGDFSRKSDVDLLVLFPGSGKRERSPVAARVRKLVSEAETTHRLPMHLAPLLVGVQDRATITPELLHDLWRDGVALSADTAALALLQPDALTPWATIRFSIGGEQSDRVQLSRKLHGRAGRVGIVQPPGLTLGRGALLVPVAQEEQVTRTLDELGATYDVLPVWREGPSQRE